MRVDQQSEPSRVWGVHSRAPRLCRGWDPGRPVPALRCHPCQERPGATWRPSTRPTCRPQPGTVRNQAGPLGERAVFDKADMALFTGAVGPFPQAYGAIMNAQQVYATALVSDEFHNPGGHGDTAEAVWKGSTREARSPVSRPRRGSGRARCQGP